MGRIKKSHLINQRGQSLIEFIIVFQSLFLLVSCLLGLLYGGLGYFWLRYQVHQYLICAASQVSVTTCRKTFFENQKQVFVFKEIPELRSSSSSHSLQAKAWVQMPLQFRISTEQKLNLPLNKNF